MYKPNTLKNLVAIDMTYISSEEYVFLEVGTKYLVVLVSARKCSCAIMIIATMY